MAIQASNIINAKSVQLHRQQRKARVQSLVQLQSPPDLQALTSALQATLELDELLSIFHQEAHQVLPLDGITYRHAESGLLLQQGVSAHHSASYGLSIQNESLGEITLTRSTRFGEEDLAKLEYLLCTLLYPIRNGLRYRAALAGAHIDALTGLSNRAALDQAISREVDLAKRTGMPLHLLVTDLDFFKQVNDRYGHLAGDCVLRSTAAQLKGLLRGSDSVFRYGGEEFVLILPNTDREGALMVAERIRAQIAATACQCDGHFLRVSCSIGLASMAEGDGPHALFDKADKALYRAKQNGRNRVECAA